MRKIVKYLLNGLAILFLVLSAYIIFATVSSLSQGKEANVFGYSISVVASDSMEDTIMTGDFIIFKNVEFSEVDVDDIVVFSYIGTNPVLQGKKIVHRIVLDNENGTFRTQGDKYNSPDIEPLSESNFIGKVMFHTSLFGIGRLRLNNLSIFFGIVIVGFLILVGFEIRNLIQNYRKLLREEREKSKDKDSLD